MSAPDYRPSFPDDRLGVGILGCGRIAQSAHLPAYEKYGVDVVGVWSRSPQTRATLADRVGHAQVYETAEELLADPRVAVVDIATPAQDRLRWVAAAVAAGKHVLAQKPLTTDPAELAPVLAEAERRELRLAVNQNGRWAPAWRLATLLVRDGAVGQVLGVTHLHDKPLPPLAGTPFDDIPHMLITDYLVHWIDITRCWLSGTSVRTVTASDTRTPGQPGHARNPWAASVSVECEDGARAHIQVPGNVHTRSGSCPFWIHGTDGTIRGSVLLGSDSVELEHGERTTRFALDGQWFVDGFAGAMGELMHAVAEGREPENSARDNLATLGLVEAARRSAQRSGSAIDVRIAL
ncbi:Gfo/Idh/MocA family oxidoreductase [Phytoactinopolyspora alkaliphila]|uniref:Gfo/Idh/MocA family oxidoreductase n=1 Tax=Phytoactinopolyspora alkaliphila TaxID=1783498 RepID=A0A6N9YIC2_9ACTN|nr:Gfo/Idh/MocA family oxidoreductase [Phytoactinopolyspora alkaliphila]NED94685.1 Gfo/Idh/MocA family oxidoreductase [Phytoactinopolyspora alkaliphila]